MSDESLHDQGETKQGPQTLHMTMQTRMANISRAEKILQLYSRMIATP